MPWLLMLAGKIGIPPQLQKFAVIVAGILLLIAVLGAAKCTYDRSVTSGYQQKIDRQADAANNQAGAERGNDAARNARSDQERHDAIHSVPDAASAGPSHALACKRLRDLGRNPPSCGGPASGH